MRETTALEGSPTDAPARLPEGYWDAEQCRAVLDETLVVRLAPDLGDLAPPERAAVDKLLAAGEILQRLYEHQRHPQAAASFEELRALDRALGSPAETRDLLRLYRLFKGPIATTLDNRRVPFLPVAAEAPGKNVYPPGAGRDELEAWMEAHPEARRELLHPRSVVRRIAADLLDRDLGALDRRPELDVLHPGLRSRLEALRAGGEEGFYAVPYSVAHADELRDVHRLLWQAAEDLAGSSPDFAAFLRHRARDLLTDDYEAGDAAWVRGRFDGLNAQIGCYETYDDELLGVKCFMSLSLLARDRERSERLQSALASLQAIEDRLPYDRHRQIRDDIPVGVYRVIADFGQARGANSATILPNDADHARKYGRTILMRHSLLAEPRLFELVKARFETAMAPEHRGELTLEGNVQRILWHEVGHYLGIDRTDDGRDLDAALTQHASLCEELKADLTSLFAAAVLHDEGHLSTGELRSFQASGMLRVLQLVRPRREQPYQTMQLMQWNYYLEHGVLRFDPATTRLGIAYDRMQGVVTELLREVLAVQRAGDPRRAESLVERWTDWRDDLHEALACRLRTAGRYRYVLVEYDALDSRRESP